MFIEMKEIKKQDATGVNSNNNRQKSNDDMQKIQQK